MQETRPSQAVSQEDEGCCELCHCECRPPAKWCGFCVGSLCVLIFPGGVILGAFFAYFGWYYFFVPWLIGAAAIAMRRFGHRRFGNKVQVLDAGLGKALRIVLSLGFFVVIPFSFLWLAFGPLHLITLLPVDPQQRALIFAVIMFVVVGECWKDGYKMWKEKDHPKNSPTKLGDRPTPVQDDEKVPCLKCGRMVLRRMAKLSNGLCLGCKGVRSVIVR